MKSIRDSIICLFLIGVIGSIPGNLATAAGNTADPTISLTVTNEPLGEVLDNITADTGYQFRLNSKWEAWPVSATIVNLPLEQGLKRLLRSLNHSIVWETDQTITIMVFGKSEAGGQGGAISHAAPPQSIPEAPPADFEAQIELEEQRLVEEENSETAESEAPADAAEAQGDEGQSADVAPPDQPQRPAPQPSAGSGAAEEGVETPAAEN